MLNNGSVLGHATAEDVSVTPGPNHDISVKALWEPDDEKDQAVGRELLSQYVSGKQVLSKMHIRSWLTNQRLQHNPYSPHQQCHHPLAAHPRRSPILTINRDTHPKTQNTKDPQPPRRRRPNRPRRRRCSTSFHRRRNLPPHHLHSNINPPVPAPTHYPLHHLRQCNGLLQPYPPRRPSPL